MRQLPSGFDTYNRVSRRRLAPPDSEGFVSRMRRVEARLDDAQAECGRHHYNEAAALLTPMLSEVPGPLAGRFFELLGRCATHGCAEDWPELFSRAQASYDESGDELGVSRILLYRGEAEAARGDFALSLASLRRASTAFAHQGRDCDKAHSAVVQARILLLQRKEEEALEKIDWAISHFRSLKKPTSEILARLLRSQIFASLDKSSAASRDLLFSERLAEKAHAGIHLRVALARAESLLWSGFPHRAHTVLRPLAPIVSARDELATTAHYHRLCGLALKGAQPRDSYARLTHAGEIFARLGQDYYLAECELGRAIALQHQGQSGGPHWAFLERLNLFRWPVLAELVQQAHRTGLSSPSPFALQAERTQSAPSSVDFPEAPGRASLFKRCSKMVSRAIASLLNFLAGEPQKRLTEKKPLGRVQPVLSESHGLVRKNG